MVALSPGRSPNIFLVYLHFYCAWFSCNGSLTTMRHVACVHGASSLCVTFVAANERYHDIDRSSFECVSMEEGLAAGTSTYSTPQRCTLETTATEKNKATLGEVSLPCLSSIRFFGCTALSSRSNACNAGNSERYYAMLCLHALDLRFHHCYHTTANRMCCCHLCGDTDDASLHPMVSRRSDLHGCMDYSSEDTVGAGVLPETCLRLRCRAGASRRCSRADRHVLLANSVSRLSAPLQASFQHSSNVGRRKKG